MCSFIRCIYCNECISTLTAQSDGLHLTECMQKLPGFAVQLPCASVTACVRIMCLQERKNALLCVVCGEPKCDCSYCAYRASGRRGNPKSGVKHTCWRQGAKGRLRMTASDEVVMAAKWLEHGVRGVPEFINGEFVWRPQVRTLSLLGGVCCMCMLLVFCSVTVIDAHLRTIRRTRHLRAALHHLNLIEETLV
jgi:hypothetical protein